MQIIKNVKDMSQACRQARRTLGLVPTMGALHQGHRSLVRQARAENATVAATIFVNPAQFGANEDLAKYPRDLEGDLDLLNHEGVDLVFTPGPEAIYPPGFDTWVDVGAIGDKLEGAHRPGHFRGVATVVAKLFNIVQPDRAYFGQKDGQQTLVVRQLVRDLNLELDVVIVPTVREPDGLALSSRNAYLTPEQRRAAPVIYQSLCRAKDRWHQGDRDAETLRQTAREFLGMEPMIERIDYISLADANTLAELDQVEGPAMLLVAVKLGTPRLIDNIILE
ncbi:MAG TPA: pantoate--beta-alanine ligase [Dehalococcoidia bacterium]|nr:pantoate--beta-alanine ligase [Dehalococcoidia bacterium]